MAQDLPRWTATGLDNLWYDLSSEIQGRIADPVIPPITGPYGG
jgi:hypothetical protein